MLAAGIIIIVVIVFLLLPLFFPIELLIDTTAGEYLFRWRGVGGARLTGALDDPVLRWWVAGWRKEKRLLDLVGPRGREKEKEKPPEHRRAGGKRPRWLTWRLMVRVVRTFRIRTFRLQLDTDDFVMNAILFPIFYHLSGGPRQWAINFDGRSELVLKVTNRPVAVLWALITEVIKPKNDTS